MIGRAYAANIERNPNGKIDKVMEKIIYEIRHADFTAHFSQLKSKNYRMIDEYNLYEMIELHSKV
ncbi:MAG TPA: hypothetical protein PLZ51_14955, partial [Aggregatilineales bacterium]|nr:hypothetical protein [Aggregatilineales bacterium]